ncbi:AbrB family transcriptional regulator [Paenibacillus sp. UNC451MF]|uniref:AbrB family transcriptional regulator n=1 Tax=Paenibacillus sp. UNC451MF TaxID=1449063 RepID=UPI001E4A5878|nr:AbrB family transcriptional regulator [Paenibacillus sp. UNC451MF]
MNLKYQQLAGQKWGRFLYTLIVGVLGALLFQLIHMPIPWLLGPMFLVLVGSKSIRSIQPYWPSAIRSSGMIIIGYTIGLSFTLETLHEIGRQLPTMILLTVLLLCCSFIIALIVSLVSGIPFPTVLMGSIPGGLTQMIPLAEEIKGVDLTVVTFLQVSRLMMIIFFVPVLVFSPLFGVQHHQQLASTIPGVSSGWQDLFPSILVFAVVCTLFAIIGNKVKLPTAYLLGPMIATILLNLSGYHGHALPTLIINFSQMFVGIYVGMLLKPEQLNKKLKIIVLAILSGIILISCSIGLSLLLTKLHDVTLVTAFLSLSPGGMDQMGIIAKEAGAELSVVICYQLFRTLFIFIAVPPLLKAVFKRVLRKTAVRH